MMKDLTYKTSVVAGGHRKSKHLHQLIFDESEYCISKKKLKRGYGFKEKRPEIRADSYEWDIKIAPRRNFELEKEFNELAKSWKKQTAHFSTMFHKLNNSNYLKIMASGPEVVPFILKDLEKSPNLWHEALYYITRENPLKGAEVNDVNKIREAWLRWGRENGKI